MHWNLNNNGGFPQHYMEMSGQCCTLLTLP